MAGNDLFRIMPIRLLGYGFPVGDVFGERYRDMNTRPFYLVGGCYIWAHCFHRAFRAYTISDNRFITASLPSHETNAVIAFFDTFIFETLASYLIPTLTSTCVYWLVDYLQGPKREGDSRARWPLPFIFALFTIIWFSGSVDRGVGHVMNDLIRPLYSARVDVLSSL
ncbi:uncharacterized protein LOC131936585 [Physella acuta]|uniref:uncharacterized protein LOC131936585 n=1 Tax=Physella acuta TaxID=109671 RepID=UPI0027DE95F7|nr:uncharacterized protein LOC131936585 [Physella acuta]